MRAAISTQRTAAHVFTCVAAPVAAFIAICVLSAAAYAQSCSPEEPRTDSGAGFTPFGVNEQVLARGGNSGPAWEWAVGTDTEAGQQVQGSLDWVSGRVYSWRLVNSGAGSQVLEIREAGSLRLGLNYPSGMDPGNALELRVSANPSIGPQTSIAASLTSLNGHGVSGSLSRSGTRSRSEQALYWYFPQMAQGFTAEGTVSLTFPAKLPSGSRVRFTVRAGTIPCRSTSNPPTVSISTPASGSVFSAPTTVTVTADAQDSDGTVEKVAFFANGTPIGTDTTSPFAIAWANVQAGAYSLTAVATDDEGLQTTSAAVPIAVNAVKALYFIHVDHLNTPRLIADSTQKTVWRWDQAEPFGNNPADEDPEAVGVAFDLPLRLPGQYYDAETLLHYNYFRGYDAGVGRYVESDPIGLDGGLNTYNYVGGAPLTGEDPFGLAKFCCRPLDSFVGRWPITKRHCYVVADEGTTYGLYPATRAGVRVGIAQIDDPRDRGGDCFDCPKLDCGPDQDSCLRNANRAYPVGAYKELGPNSNTYAGSLARQCCKGGVPSGVRDAPGIDSSPPAVNVPLR
jgi:RHS repeat-associated protein